MTLAHWSGSAIEDGADSSPPVPCHHLRIQILANHLNGKDTHVRGLRIHGEAAYVQYPLFDWVILASVNLRMLPYIIGIRRRKKGIRANDSQRPLPLSPSSEASTPRRSNAGKKLLELGHDGLSGFTSQDFKMHEFLR